MHRLLPLFCLIVSFTFSGCYSFRGIDIPSDTNTYYVSLFDNNADNAPPILNQTIREALREKIRTESKLIWTENNPDLEFIGKLVDYRVTSEAPRPGETTAITRLTIITAVEFINHKYEDKSWKSNFSFFFDFASNVALASVEEEAQETIIDQMMEDIFNKAFTSW
ncbi:MAG: hypothetical protein DHS20C18_02960 [Saprospiraceae bacterium]|nr:MAG: hypothetical protein DHS20C18_02960 [Saprospiraceae bacterium]